jgi:hypothetical protein
VTCGFVLSRPSRRWFGESRVDQLLRSALPAAINQQQVKKSARDPAVNMSAQWLGMVFYAAADLQKQINEMIALLNDEELRATFARHVGVIEQVSQTEFGRKRNSSKYRMLRPAAPSSPAGWPGTSSACATQPCRWSNCAPSRIRRGGSPARRRCRIRLTTTSSMPARWVGRLGDGRERVEQMSQPRESPQQASRPIQILSIARDLLERPGLAEWRRHGRGQERPHQRPRPALPGLGEPHEAGSECHGFRNH